MDLWFGHHGIVALLLTSPPAPSDESSSKLKSKLSSRRVNKKDRRKPTRTYDASGWTTYESTSAALKLFTRTPRHMQAATWNLVIEINAATNTASTTTAATTTTIPAAAASTVIATPTQRVWQFELTASEFSDRLKKKSWARAEDSSLCLRLYEAQMSSSLGGLSSLVLRFPPDDAPRVGVKEARLLGRLIDRKLCGRLLDLRLNRVPGLGEAFGAFCTPLAGSGRKAGPLSNHLMTLSLDGNGIGDKGAKALAAATGNGALRALCHLSLSSNGIGGEGLKALAAVTNWDSPGGVTSLQDLKKLNLYDNALGSTGCTTFAKELARGAFASVEALYLGRNAIGTEGCLALSSCLLLDEDGDGSGALPHLRELHLYSNGIDERGAIALGKALHGWGLHRVTEIVLDGNRINDRAKRFVLDALKRRAWARVMLHQWLLHCKLGARSKLSTYGERAAARRSLSPVSPRPIPRQQHGSAVRALAQWQVGSAAEVL